LNKKAHWYTGPIEPLAPRNWKNRERGNIPTVASLPHAFASDACCPVFAITLFRISPISAEVSREGKME
jgi:hypothetical protein